MKIIRPGREPRGKTMTGECPHCRCVIECYEDEALVEDWPNGDSRSYVRCPSCDDCLAMRIYVRPKTEADS